MCETAERRLRTTTNKEKREVEKIKGIKGRRICAATGVRSRDNKKKTKEKKNKNTQRDP